MCGRFTLAAEPEALRAEFGDIELDQEYVPRYNIAPTQPVLVLGSGRDGAVRTGWLRWGLVPYWASDISIGSRMINARSETVMIKPAFRDSFASRRCLILADGFYEWALRDEEKAPYRVHLHGNRPFAFAGIWDRWKDPAGADDAEPLYSCAIITTDAASAIARIHERMPVIVARPDRQHWLDGTVEEAHELLQPYAGQDLEAYEVSRLVNRVENDVPECIEPVTDRPSPGATVGP